MTTPLESYREQRRAGLLEADTAQELAVEKLQILTSRLERYRPAAQQGGLKKLFGFGRHEEPPRGLYLFGDVGRGKSMLMDLFFDLAPVEKKRRVHFHAFMREVHARINRFRRTPADERDGDDPLPVIARELAEEAWLLCFDEFEVRDVADAMILGRLFGQMFDLGVVMVATSNRVPDDLYKGGLNRQLFVPFIERLKTQLEIYCLDGHQDYRLMQFVGTPVYHVPVDEKAAAALDEAFERLSGSARGAPAEIEVAGRKVPVPEQAKGVARFAFADLCAQALAANDYLALAERYHTVVLAGVPRLGPANRNEARRFVLLIDVLYDNRIKLVCSAEAEPEALYPEGDGAFEFQRTASRLREMQSADYVSAPHPLHDYE